MSETPHLTNSGQSAALAQQRAEDGVPGFYVIDFASGYVVAGPFKRMGTAEYQAALREPPSMAVTEVKR